MTVGDVQPRTIKGDHGGTGPIVFRRLLRSNEFTGPIDFVDYTIVPPGSTIGLHAHVATEETYLVVAGRPLVEVEGDRRRIEPGGAAVVRSGQTHGLSNDTAEDIQIFVFQVRLTPDSEEDAK